jgi:acyl-CoA thioester hydrolase
VQSTSRANILRHYAPETYTLLMDNKVAEIFMFDLRVTYADCTLGNHVYYGRYLDFLEAARGEFHREIGFPLLSLQEQDTIFPAIQCSIKYLKPARYDDVLQIRLSLSKLSQVRLTFEYEILREEQVLLKAITDHVCTSVNEKPKRIPEQLAAKLSKYLQLSITPT